MIASLSILWHYLQARRNFTRWKTRETLEIWQDRQVKNHLRQVLPRSAYYRRHFDGLSLENWRDFPLSTKATLMVAFDEWNTLGITLAEAGAVAEAAERSRDFSTTIQGCAVGLSSGTTGSRGVFLVSPEERRRWAGTILARALRGTLGQTHRAAMFLRADSPLYQTVGSKRFSFSFFDLFAPFERHWPRLRQLRPTLLAAPPSALVRLAASPGAADLLTGPRILLSVADVLDDADRAFIEAGFDCKAGQLYQATEGFLAATCPEGNLHWNEDAIFVQKEWIDAKRTRYHPIITDFRRTTQPVIRFRLDDVIVNSDEELCPCGSIFARLEKIEGRQDDVFYLSAIDGEDQVMIFPDFVRRALILALPAGREYTVVQNSLDSWTVETEAPDLEGAITREIEDLCHWLKVKMPRLEFAPWTAPHPGAKRRRIRRKLTTP
jgi:putative adenylate-forming enzyme